MALKWDQVCGFPACARRIDVVPLPFRAKKGIHGSMVSILGLLLCISTPLSLFLSLFYFVYRVLWAHFTSSFHANYRIVIQWSAQLLDSIS